MKQDLLIEFLRKLKANPNLKKKIKIFAAVGVIGFLVVGTLTFWAGITAFSFLTAKTAEVVSSPMAQTHLKNLNTGLIGLPKIQALSCWNKVQNLMTVEPWLTRPVLDNLMNLKVACLEDKPAPCEGHECNQNEFDADTEGETI